MSVSCGVYKFLPKSPPPPHLSTLGSATEGHLNSVECSLYNSPLMASLSLIVRWLIQQTRHVHPMLDQRWADVRDSGPTVEPLRVDVSCLLGIN